MTSLATAIAFCAALSPAAHCHVWHKGEEVPTKYVRIDPRPQTANLKLRILWGVTAVSWYDSKGALNVMGPASTRYIITIPDKDGHRLSSSDAIMVFPRERKRIAQVVSVGACMKFFKSVDSRSNAGAMVLLATWSCP